jgi:hypothetical protein
MLVTAVAGRNNRITKLRTNCPCKTAAWFLKVTKY